MAEFVLDVGSYDWTVPGTNKDDLGATDVNIFNQAVAISLQTSLGFGERLKVQALDVAQDAAKLAGINKLLGGPISGVWPPAGSAPEDFIVLFNALLTAGAPMAGNMMQTTLRTPGSGYVKPEKISLTYTAAIASQIPTVVFNPGAPQGGLNPADYAEGAVIVSLPGPLNTPPRTLFANIGGELYELVQPQQFYQTTQPTQEVVTAATPQLKKDADKLTQITQGKQAFMQDLIASMNKFFDLATNLVQRDERNRQDIVGRF